MKKLPIRELVGDASELMEEKRSKFPEGLFGDRWKKELPPSLSKKRKSPKHHEFTGMRYVTKENWEEFKADVTETDFEMLDLLMNHYGIHDEIHGHGEYADQLLKWARLSLCLARDFVPGFQYAEPRGRKKDWKKEAKFMQLITSTMIDNKCSAVDACKIIDRTEYPDRFCFDTRPYYEQFRHLRDSDSSFASAIQNMDAGELSAETVHEFVTALLKHDSGE